MKISRNILALAVCALAVVSIGAQAAGVDVHGFVLAHPDLFAGLGALALAGEVKALDPEEVRAALKKIGDSVKEEGSKALAEAEKHGQLATETKGKVDQLLSEQGELKNRLTELEQKAVRPGGENELPEDAGMAFEKFMDENPEIKAQLARISQGKSISVPMHRKAITNSGSTGAALNYPAQTVAPIVRPLQRRLTIRDLIAPGRTEAAAIFYPKESGFTNAASVVSEGSLKPESNLTFDPTTEAVVTIAHWLRISKQMAADVPALVSYINSRLTYGLKLVEENQLLNGSGTGGNIEGIYTAATPYANLTSLPNETDIDKIRLAILQAELAYAEVNGIVLHPTNWALMELTKDTTGQYVFARPQESATPRLWGRDVVATPAMSSGRFLVGDFAQHAQIFDREDASVAISAEDRDNFVRNMLTILVEERLAMAIYRPEAFIKGRLETSTGAGV